MELSTKQKIEEAVRENPNPRNIVSWLKYQEKELTYALKKINKDENFRHTQGQLAIVDELQSLLTKAIS